MSDKIIKHRSIHIPITLSDRIDVYYKTYGISSVNSSIIELLELGLIKSEENIEDRNLFLAFMEKMDVLINILTNKYEAKDK